MSEPNPPGHSPNSIKSRPRYPYLPDSMGDLEYDKFRNPESSPGHAAIAVVGPDGVSISESLNAQWMQEEILIHLKLILQVLEKGLNQEASIKDIS